MICFPLAPPRPAPGPEISARVHQPASRCLLDDAPFLLHLGLPIRRVLLLTLSKARSSKLFRSSPLRKYQGRLHSITKDCKISVQHHLPPTPQCNVYWCWEVGRRLVSPTHRGNWAPPHLLSPPSSRPLGPSVQSEDGERAQRTVLGRFL